MLLAWLAVLSWGCAGSAAGPPPSFVDRARLAAHESSDAEVVGRWLAAELVAPGGDPKRARLARLRLEELDGAGRHAALAQALEADVHGRFAAAAAGYVATHQAQRYTAAAAAGYVATLEALRSSSAAEVPLVAWFAAERLVALRTAVPAAWSKARTVVERAIATPGSLGWRARGTLLQWWSRERLRGGEKAVDESAFGEISRSHGCLRHALLAGPFGHARRSDHRVHFEAERPGPWPAQFPPNRRRLERPETRDMVSHGCLLRPDGGVAPGIYYVQSFVELDAAQDVIVAVQGAFAIFIDDVEVLARDPARWGTWPRSAVQVRLTGGRHRIVARIGTAETSIRLLDSAGQPMGTPGSADQRRPYRLVAPQLRPEPSVLEPFLRASGVPARAAAPRGPTGVRTSSPVLRYLASYLAHVEGQHDLASVILEPLVKSADKATPAALAQHAVFVDADPIFPPGVARDLAKDLRERAAKRDGELWGPRLWLVLAQADKSRPAEVATRMEQLAKKFPQVPMVIKRLAAAYGQLGWTVEHGRAIARGAKRFPEDTELLAAMRKIHERRGERGRADELGARIRQLEPTEEVDFRAALKRRDYSAAIAELKRIGAVRQDRRDIALRIADLLVRAGKSSESIAKLELALAEEPMDAGARLALADAQYAAGDEGALAAALVEALRTGAETRQLRAAIELVEGMTDLAPYRRDGLKVIADAEASGLEMPGTAARILDYVTLWVENDGSARMLEHEIIRVQAREGIQQHLEQQVPRGVLLRMRTIKQDGRVFEPEFVPGKRTVTMPHLEVGDYIETESIWVLRGDGQGGRAFLSPLWWFREQNVSYHLSEFVVVSPQSRALTIETTGDVPPPTVERSGALVVRRWRVDQSVALPEEPYAAPFGEYLPSVRVGWGIDLEERLRRLMDLHRDETPRDPRLRRIARSIVAAGLVEGAKKRRGGGREKLSADQRARRIYRWVLDNVQPGKERFPPRIITGKSGDRTRAFLHLCRLAGLDARFGMVQDRLSPPPTGPFSEALKFTAPAVRLRTEQGTRWLMVGERFAPYGFLPSALRGQPAVLLDLQKPWTKDEPLPIVTETTSSGGSEGRIATTGSVKLAADGAADVELTQHYHGKYAVVLRTRLNNVPDARLQDVIEAEVLGLALPGARLKDLDVAELDQLDEPVGLTMEVQAPAFAKVAGRTLAIDVPFLPRIGVLAELPERETPVYISEQRATRLSIRLRIALPKGAVVATPLEPQQLEDGGRSVVVADRVEGRTLILERSLDVPAGRVQPRDYAAFRRFALAADGLLHRTVRIELSR